MLNFADMTWEQVRDLPKGKSVALLAVGAVEAHGPHLPLSTDVIISEAMARGAGALLESKGWHPVLLPSLYYTAAPFAAGFPGTITLRPETFTALLIDIAAGVASAGFALLGIANSHLDPAHLGALKQGVQAIETDLGLPVAYPSLISRRHALRMSDEFKSGACHAGQYETSVVIAERPGLVHESLRRALEPNPNSLSRAIRDGKQTFEESGGPRAYFGYPANATHEEGEQTVHVLADILAEAVQERLAARSGGT